MTNDFIALQAKSDDMMRLLRADGYGEAADVMLALRKEAFAREQRLQTIHRALAETIGRRVEKD